MRRRFWLLLILISSFVTAELGYADELLDTVKSAEKACTDQRFIWSSEARAEEVISDHDDSERWERKRELVSDCVTTEKARVISSFKGLRTKSPESRELITSFITYLQAMLDVPPLEDLSKSPQKAAYDKAEAAYEIR